MKKLQSIDGTRKDSGVLILICFLAVFFMVPEGIYESSVQAGPIVRIGEGDAWRYFKGTAKPPFKWTHADFDDSAWPNGFTGLGYGRSNRTNLDDMRGNYSRVYSRRQFNINNTHAVTKMNFSINCDGPFIAYLNGIEIIRNDSALEAEIFDIGGFIHELLPGKNVISVECNNDDIDSTDFSFVPFFEILEGQGATQ